MEPDSANLGPLSGSVLDNHVVYRDGSFWRCRHCGRTWPFPSPLPGDVGPCVQRGTTAPTVGPARLGPNAQCEIDSLNRIVADPRRDPAERANALLIAHQRWDIGGCLCGWAELGKSHSVHVVDMLTRASLLHARPS